MDFFVENLPYILAGISVGGQYALIAIGYTMVYGILRLINFAHGDMFMIAGLTMVYLAADLPMTLAIPIIIVFTVVLGCLIEKVAYAPLRSAPRMSIMISAIGVRNVVESKVDFTKSRNLIVAAIILVTALGLSSGATFTIGGVSITLSALACASLAGIILNAILPGKDYEFTEDEPKDTGVNFAAGQNTKRLEKEDKAE